MSEPCSCGPVCACGCCEGTEPVTPESTANRPGLDALAYRVGTHASFLETMLARLSGGATRALTTRDGGDASIAWLDAWALVADVLTFYQERIANEGYLRTATERRSVLELARLVGYTPRPGVSASTYLAYTVDHVDETVVPAGSAVSSVPGPGEMPQTFETSTDLTARPAWNNLQVRLTRPQQPAVLATEQWPVALYFKGIATNLKPNDPLLIDTGGAKPALYRTLAVAPEAASDRTRVMVRPWSSSSSTTVAPQSTVGQVAELHQLIDSLAVPARPQPRSAAHLDRDPRRLFDAASDLGPRLLAVAHPELAPSLYTAWSNLPATPPPALEVCALRTRASVFGHNAPRDLRRNSDTGAITGTREWNVAKTDRNTLMLDAVYPQILPDSWVVVQRPAGLKQPSSLLIAKAIEVGERSAASYGIAAKATRIALDEDWLEGKDFEASELDENERFDVIRGTSVYAQCEGLELAEAPIPDAVCRGEIELADLHDGLQPGRWLLVAGERSDLVAVSGKGMDERKLAVPGVRAVELMMISGVEQRLASPKREVQSGGATGTMEEVKPLPGERFHTTVTLARPLQHCYRRDTLKIYANVVAATHGATRFEVLGSGNAATPHQAFTLKQPPLTYVSAPTPSGIESTLQVRVNDVLWHAVDCPAGLGPAERGYAVRTDDGAQTTVVFGDGERGARLPTGVENVRATYRTGIGKEGNLAAGQISQLATRPLGVNEVVNPLPATGGAGPESRDQARRNAPLAVLALDRLVSTQDYADFARTFAGVGKASARRLTDGRVQLVHVTIAGEDDIPIREDSDLFANLEDALRRFGDPREPLLLALRRRAFMVVQAGVRVQSDYLWEKVEPKVRAAMVEAFGFTRRDLGQDVLLSEVYRVLQGVPGVDFADVDLFDCRDADDLRQVLVVDRRPPPRLRADLADFDKARRLQPAQLIYLTAEVPDTLILKERRS